MIIIGIDFGDKRIGIAKSEGIIASGICTIKVNGIEDAAEKTANKIKELGGEKIILGLPKNMDGSEGESAQNAREFGALLQEKTGLPVAFVDERGTTVTAHGYLNQTDVRGKKRKAVVDSVAAVIILQNYLDYRRNCL